MEQQNMSKEEQIGFHKGSLATLAKEREEMLKIVNVVEQLMQAHIKALKDLGVDLESQAQQISQNKQSIQPKGINKPIDELL
jgi:UDP-N-acetylglucosamine enolpyruvyl transferase